MLVPVCAFHSLYNHYSKSSAPAGLSGFAVFVSVTMLLLALFLLSVPVIDARYGKLSRLARALSETRVAFILAVIGTSLDLLIAYVTSLATYQACKLIF